MTSHEITARSAENSISPLAAAQKVENAYDTGDVAQASALLSAQFTDYLKNAQTGPAAALAEWKQIGADDAAKDDNVLPALALDWGQSYYTWNTLISQSGLQSEIANPGGDSTGDKMVSKLSAQYLLTNYDSYAGASLGAGGQETPDQLDAMPIIIEDVQTAEDSLPKPAGWNAPQPVEKPEGFWDRLLDAV